MAAKEKVNEIFDVDFYIATQVFQSFQSLLVLLLLSCFYRLSNDSRLIKKNKQTNISEAENFIIKKNELITRWKISSKNENKHMHRMLQLIIIGPQDNLSNAKSL